MVRKVQSIDGFVVVPTRSSQHRPVIAARPQATKVETTPPRQQLTKLVVPPKLQFDTPQITTPTPDRSARRRRSRHAKWSRKHKVLTTVLGLFIICGLLGGSYGLKLMNSFNKVFHGNIVSDASALFSNAKLKGEDQGRVNILLAGDSADDPHHGGADLTDSIMVVSIDTKDHTAFMLSVPRDLWVNIPGWSHQKINAANDVTGFSQSGYPNGGMGQLEEVVQTNLGIPIDYYALVNYTAFKQAVDAVGGIRINLQSNDPRGVYDSFTNLRLPNGWVNLDGQQALNLARARGDVVAGDVSYGLGSDFDRTQHQRQMFTALGQKAQTAGVIANPFKVSQLFSAFGSNVATDLTVQDTLRLVQLGKQINQNNVQSLTYAFNGPNPLLKNYVDPYSGQEALIPAAGVDDFSQLQAYYRQLTSSNPIAREGATVAILNGSAAVGLAHHEEQALQAQGYNVVSISDADSQYPSSMIIDNSNGQKSATKAALQKIFNKATLSTTAGSNQAEAAEAKNYTANFVIVLGQDFAASQSSATTTPAATN